MSKQIDDIFKKNLKNYRQPVPGDVWDNIEQALNQNKKKGVQLYKLFAAAGILLIVALSMLFVLNQTNNTISENNNISQTGQKELKTGSNTETSNQNEPIIIDEVKNENKNPKSEILYSHGIEKTVAELKVDKSQSKELNKETLEKLISKSISINVLNKTAGIAISYKHSNPKEIQDLVLAVNTKNDKIKTPVKWVVGGEFAPSYSYRYLSGAENDLEKTYFNSVETPVSSYSGGLNVQVVLHKRLSVQTGVYYATMGQSINHLNVYSNKAFDQVEAKYQKDLLNTFTLSNSIGTVEFNSRYIFVDETNFRVNINSDNKYFFDATDPAFDEVNAEIHQNLEYIEIPLYLNYKVVDRKIDLNITGGVGANMLVGNNVYLISGNNKENIGKTNGVKTMNYSGIFALGLEFPLLRNLSFRLQPAVKYYINTVNPDSDIESHPYSFAVFSGFNFSL
ncbi:MAG: hypothetical protein A2X13_14155 [Bacteroidetes bacterium GWC2_33_15]|nr:MAG: hypothetical protein A2X10_09370 [Bacteroidetes bacterium GWA2_33_15]OFX50483.1 MAG: hypothetical protein A2X13_14155 [Bacteroidetes bacterium GWC2_33_15]OFX66599.1 MAG: hypothetical protein A2X15_07720 [Bacteroidetes bacterium GWB2_32_14]OFX69217.1 MAG: hypothetical protein A2X14_08650 [Bacteroidetes bacterium GWD2_33_33]HAN18527.1 hypothetical protein [Bacteroidales bacterium]